MRNKLLFFIAAACALACCAPRLSASPLVSDEGLANAGFRKHWQASLPLNPGEVVRNVVRLDDALYVTTSAGVLHAVKADDGLLRWSVRITESAFKVYEPSLSHTASGWGSVVVAATDATWVLDRFTGRELARWTLPFPPGSPTVMIGDTLLTGSANGRFYALKTDEFQARQPFKIWEVATGGPITSAPVVFGGENLLFASQDGVAYACRGGDKSFLWSYRTGGPIVGTPAVDADGAYVASADRSLYKLSLANGTVLWRARLQRPLNDGPIVVNGKVFQLSSREAMVVFDAETGAEAWRNAGAVKLAAHTSSGDILFTEDRRLVIASHETGEVLQTLDAPQVAETAANTLDHAVFLAAADGRVLCIHLSNTPYLTRQQVSSSRKQLNLAPTDAKEVDPPLVAPKRENPATADPLRSRREPSPTP